MRVGLVDIDGHHFPNLALMKLSAWHKSKGDKVEFADPMFGRYDRVYQSKVFTFTPDCPDNYILDLLARVKWIRYIRFACDTVAQLEPVIRCVEELQRRGVGRHRFFVYCLIGDDVAEALERINALRKLRVAPFAQPYRDFDNRIEPTTEQRRLARWCNHKAIFKSVEFKNYKR